VAGNATLVVDPHNTNEIAESMHRILATPELSGKLVRRGLARAAEFSWDQAARETIEVYKKVVA
jgi:glycosyltransferase involved in cell wall biosynthesis